MDIVGPVSHEGYKNIRYLLTLVDDATHWVSLLKLWTKDNVYTQYVQWSTNIFTQYGIKIKQLQSNNDTVFCRRYFQDYLISQGTKSRLTVKHTL